MVQWTNIEQSNGFANPTQLCILCKMSGTLHLVEPGLKTDRQDGGRWNAGKDDLLMMYVIYSSWFQKLELAAYLGCGYIA